MSIVRVRSKFVSHTHTLRRVTVVGGATAAAVLLFAGSAWAHITVTPNSVTAGSSTVLTFHVPNEEANADTVKVDVQIPIDHPIAQLLVQPVPGWTFTVKNVTLAKPIVTDDGSFSQAVSEVIWSGGRILPGQFQSFQISADPMPTGESQMTFKAIQTYSNGDVVRWIDVSQPGQPEPAHPAPVVTLTTTTAAASTGAPHPSAAAPASSGSSGASTALGAAGLAVGLLACLLVLMVVRQNRRLMAGAGPGSDPAAANGRDTTAGEQVLAGTKATGRQPVPPAAKASGKQSQRRRRG
jgi:periplasmic copper chaperone A